MNRSRRQFLRTALAAPFAARVLMAAGIGRPVSGSAVQAGCQFRDVSQAAGIDFVHSFGETELSNIVEATGSGCAWIDYDNDGRLDLYVLNGRYLPGLTDNSSPDGRHASNRLYHNNGDGTFTDVTEKAGLGGNGFAMGVAVGDYDNDGYDDIFLTNYNSSILYHNNGDGTFTDVTAHAGVSNPFFGTGAAWIDYDRDGHLDLFVGNYLRYDPGYRTFYSANHFPGPLDYAGETNRLFHNNGDGTFTEVTRAAGIFRAGGRAMGVAVGDFDNDGWPDIYVANDSMESYLFRNNHNGTFSEVALQMGVAFGQDGETDSAMGPIFADLENRGWLDLFVTDARYHRLYRNLGSRGFEDVTASSGVAEAGAQYVSWGDGVFDFDNDGWKDIFIVNGGLNWPVPSKPSLLRNLGNGNFADVSAQAGPAFFTGHVGRGACFGDFDNDGRIDAFVVALTGRGALLRNQAPAGAPAAHWLMVKLVGRHSNRNGYGARLEAVTGSLRQMVECGAGGYLSQSDPRPHFGLGSSRQVDSLTVRWPSGIVQVLKNIAGDQILTVQEPDGPLPAKQ